MNGTVSIRIVHMIEVWHPRGPQSGPRNQHARLAGRVCMPSHAMVLSTIKEFPNPMSEVPAAVATVKNGYIAY